jgi:hypothetical protein
MGGQSLIFKERANDFDRTRRGCEDCPGWDLNPCGAGVPAAQAAHRFLRRAEDDASHVAPIGRAGTHWTRF